VNDDDLRKQFQELRDHDARIESRFSVPRGRRAQRPRLVALSAMFLILSAAVFALIGVRSRSTTFSESDRVIAQSVAAWRPPTRFLLRTTGDEILTTTPTIPDARNLMPPSKGVVR
jgi:hypothetical protein